MPKPIDPLVRRLITGTLFAVAFVWLAINYFDVDIEVIWVLLVFSVAFVLGLMALGLVFSLVLRLGRRGRANIPGTEDQSSDRMNRSGRNM